MITQSQVLKWLEATAAVLEENRQYLTDLDSPIGDADHGINMDRGFKKIVSKLPGVEDKDIGTILKTSGMALVTSVGGAGGPLYGTLLMDAGKAVVGKEELSDDDLVALLAAGLKGVIRIGKTNLEDKTMVDALHPALEALREALADGKDTVEALHLMTDAAHKGMKDTIPMLARKGRASYLGERSIGHQDPGATSSYLLLKTLTSATRTQGRPLLTCS
jgi:dihydroxyacetone kinase-like protein